VAWRYAHQVETNEILQRLCADGHRLLVWMGRNPGRVIRVSAEEAWASHALAYWEDSFVEHCCDYVEAGQQPCGIPTPAAKEDAERVETEATGFK
jgi:hypothetical protein